MKTNIKIFLYLFFIFVLSIYVTYEHATSCDGVAYEVMIERHKRLIAGNSEFFNPWQYRVFSHWILEVIIKTQKTIIPSSNIFYSFYILRFIQLLLIFGIGYYYLKNFSQNEMLIWIMLLLAAYNFTNSTYMSDFAFNTYFDILFYILAGIIIFKGNVQWMVPLSILAAFNRETSALIPVLAILFGLSYQKGKVLIQNTAYLKNGIMAFIVFLLIFLGLRFYFGFRPAMGIHGMTSAIDYLKYNFSFVRLYPLLLGTLGIVPILVVIGYKKLSYQLKLIFWVVIPIWFIIHFIKSTVVETRLFLVPQIFVFLPALLYLIDREIKIFSMKLNADA